MKFCGLLNSSKTKQEFKLKKNELKEMCDLSTEQAFVFVINLMDYLMTNCDDSITRDQLAMEISFSSYKLSKEASWMVLTSFEEDSRFMFDMATLGLSDLEKISLLSDMSKVIILDHGIIYHRHHILPFLQTCEDEANICQINAQKILLSFFRIIPIEEGFSVID